MYKRYKNESVINTDNYDRRRFKKIYGMSQGLRNLEVAEKPFPTFEPLLGDIWSSLYKMKPILKEKEQLQDVLKTNHSLLIQMFKDERFEHYRNYTKLDELASAIGTVKFGEKTKDWLEEQREENEALDNQLMDIQHMQQQLEKQERDRGAGQGNKQLQQDIQQATESLNEQVEQQLNNQGQSFSNAMLQAMKETKDMKESVKSLLSGMQAGSGKAELKKVPLRDQIQLADKIASDQKIKQIADWAGRLKQIARQKQKSKHHETSERSGVTLGNDINRLLPMELALYNHEATKTDFFRKFVEGQTMQYETIGKETIGKGPIILCLDQSGSMSGLDTQSKGFALAFMSIAKRQRRDFCLIPFSTRTEVYQYPKGKIKSDDMINLCQNFLGGGTDFKLPLESSLRIINDNLFKNSDIIFVTDGEDSLLDSAFLERFNQIKKEKEFSVLSLVIGGQSRTVELFSDRVIHIRHFSDRDSFQAFEI